MCYAHFDITFKTPVKLQEHLCKFSSKTVQAILCAVQTAFSQHNTSSGLWPCLPDQNLQFEFYLRGMVSDQEYGNNLQTEDKMSESNQNAVPTI
jgi:hypothetical protein